MADYGVNIKFRTVGLSQLDKAKARVKELEKSVSKIRSLDLGKALRGKTGDRLAEATGQIRRYATQLNKTGKAIGNTRVQQQAALESFENLRDSVKIGSPIFNTLNKAIAQQTKLMNVNTISTNKNSRAKRNNNRVSRGGIGGRGSRIGGALSSGLVSGAFPLLFGQGPLGGIAGFTGGFGGSLVGGQMGGFAGGLVATAALQQIQTFSTEVGKLGAALNENTMDVSALSSALGITGTEFEKNLKIIQKLGGEEAAFALARQKMIDLVGNEGVEALTKFGDEFTELGNNFAKIMTLMKTSFAKFLEESGVGAFISTTVERSALLRQADQSENKNVQDLVAQRELFTSRTATRQQRKDIAASVGFTGRFDDVAGQSQIIQLLNQKIAKEQKSVNKKKEEIKTNKTNLNLLDAALKKTDDNIIKIREKLQFGEQEALIREKIRGIEGEIERKLTEQEEIRVRTNLTLERSLQQQLEFSQAIGQSFKDNFKDAITGASTFREAMVNVLNTIKNKLIDSQIDRLFDSARSRGGSRGGGIGGFLGGLFGGFNKKKSFDFVNIPNLGIFGDGGKPPVNKPSIVGDKGAELFVPRSSGTIIPNNQLGGSTTNIVNVSVDASGSSVSGNDQDAQALGAVIGAAVQAQLVKEKRPGGLLTR